MRKPYAAAIFSDHPARRACAGRGIRGVSCGARLLEIHAHDEIERIAHLLREDVEVVYRVFCHGKCLRKPASLTRRALDPKSAGPSYRTMGSCIKALEKAFGEAKYRGKHAAYNPFIFSE